MNKLMSVDASGDEDDDVGGANVTSDLCRRLRLAAATSAAPFPLPSLARTSLNCNITTNTIIVMK